MAAPPYGGPIPVDRYLVPAQREALPDGFTRLQVALVRGVPFQLALDRELTLTLFVPIGRANVWRDADAAQLVATSATDRAPNDPAAESSVDVLARMPARLVLQANGAILAAAPLVSGLRRTIPDDGDAANGTRIELRILGWELRAGSVRDAGDTGSTLDIAWRRIDQAADTFVQPLLDPRIAARMPKGQTVLSDLGGERPPPPPKENAP
jgi:hypothetical protein